jgi:predicted ferric reductase
MKPQRWLPPALCLALPLAGMAWAWPVGLSPWRSVSILSAWAGCGALLASLVLMVRDPRFAAALGGLDSLYRWHHRSGTVGYCLLLIHPLALATDGLDESPQVAWQTLSPLAQDWPEWLGWLGLLLLMAGLASTFMPRLPYRRWRALHYLLGLGVLLGLAHLWAILGGSLGVLGAIGIALAALGWRLVVSDFGALARPYRVSAVRHPATDLVEVTLAPCAAALAATPGQFVLAAFGDGEGFHGCREFHPFTVSGIGPGGVLKLDIKALGPCTRHLQHLTPGVTLRLEGPFGDFLAAAGDGPQLWLAGGIGIAPFLAVLRSRLPAQPTHLIHLFRHADDAGFSDEIQALAAGSPNLSFVPVASGDSPPDLGPLLAAVPGLAGREAWLCGPPGLNAAASRALRRAGVPPEAIHFESFEFRS